MAESNFHLRPRLPRIWNYRATFSSVAAALRIAHLPALHLHIAPVSSFLCAAMISAWLGGVGPGLLAIAHSSLAFDYYFLVQQHSFAIMPEEISRLVIFEVAAPSVELLRAE
jgi:K+-sensing histidine kinase KdpD